MVYFKRAEFWHRTGSEVSPAARNILASARIPRASKLLICGLFQKGRVLAQDGDGTGLCVYAKRLEKGKFACLWSVGDGEPVRLTTTASCAKTRPF